MYTYCIINYFVLIPNNKKKLYVKRYKNNNIVLCRNHVVVVFCDKMLEIFNNYDDKAEITWIFVFLNEQKCA